MKKLIVLDFAMSEVIIYNNVDFDQIEDVEEWLQIRGFKLTEIDFMFGEDIEIINK